jgi:hypothetical protein
MKPAPNPRSLPRHAIRKVPALALLAAAVTICGAHAALVAPVLAANTTTITEEPRLSNPDYHLTSSSDSSIDSEAFQP